MYRYPAKVEKVGLDPLLPDPVVQIATPTQVVGKNIGFLDIWTKTPNFYPQIYNLFVTMDT